MGKKSDEKTNKVENSMKGCYGEVVTHDRLDEFLEDNFEINRQAEEAGEHRFAQCIWGLPGIGKTGKCKQYRNKETTWQNKKVKWNVIDVPLAQFEEMGDLHGLPCKALLMRGPEGERWVPEEHIPDYRANGWEVDRNYTPTTRMAPPDWVPTRPGPAILLMDDWNRASVRIVKGIMQLLQNYGMVSWQLPPGSNIVLTGNPDMQDFLVTSIDSAILTRIKHITLMPDAKLWAQWATQANLDPRGINFILRYPEMMMPKGEAKLTNPRTLSEFFRISKKYSLESDKDKLLMHARSLLDAETVSAFVVFASRENEMTVEPESILTGQKDAFDQCKALMSRSEPRIDILSVICERLFATMIQPTCQQTEERKKNFQKFITSDFIPADMRDQICRRLAKNHKTSSHMWLLGDKELRKMILESVH